MREFQRSIEYARADFDYNFVVRCQVWSFAWYKGRILAVAKNDNKTHPLNLINKLNFSDGNTHFTKGKCAELVLFLRLKNKTNVSFSKITIINVRIDKNGNVCMARPCVSCKNLIAFMKPKAVYFSNDTGSVERYL